MESGRSNHVDIIIPPYGSTSSRMYAPAASPSACALSLKVGESPWLATIWQWVKPFSGTAKATSAERLRVT